MSVAQSLYELFAGSDISHGTYTQEDASDGDPKVEIKRTARTIREPASVDHWQMHLNGTRALGIVPIGPGDCCAWAALDIDKYPMDHSEVVKLLDDNHVPAIVCKSKSGGAHVFLFFEQPLPAVVVVPKAKQLAVLLGHSGCEVYPRQETLDRSKDFLGNWLNMPYFKGDETTRMAVDANGLGLTVSQFINLAKEKRISADSFGKLQLHKSQKEFEDGPPCLETLVATGGFTKGNRNDGLMALGVLAKKMQPNDWKTLLADWNTRYVGLTAAEALGVIKSLSKKDYNYRCTKEPIKSVCNSMLCQKRKFGIDTSGQDVSLLENIMVYETDPPIFIVSLKLSNGKTVSVKVDGAKLKNPDLFQTSVLNTHYHLITSFRVNAWEKRVAALLEEAQHVAAPEEAGEKGQFFEILTQFLTDSYAAETREDMLQGKPWRNDEDDHYYFRLQDLHTTLDRHKFTPTGKVRSWLASEIRDLGGKATKLRIEGRNTPISVFSLRCDIFPDTIKLNIPLVDESPL